MIRLAIISSFFFLLLSCGSISEPHISNKNLEHPHIDKILAKADIGKPYSNKVVHQVKTGETLYSIAKFYGVDYKILANSHHIAPPYTIFPGQQLIIAKNKLHKNIPKNIIRKKSNNEKIGDNAKTKKISLNKPWLWPAKGKVVKKFWQSGGALANQGIDIAVKPGTAVRATQAGKIVYQGTGLVGFGKVIIVKHNDTYLSAYTHNQILHVAEGDLVEQGQVIGTIGGGSEKQAILHFEVRKNGKAIDPLSVLSED